MPTRHQVLAAMPPPVRLQVDPGVARRLDARLKAVWKFLDGSADGHHGFLQAHAHEWVADNERLARKIEGGDDSELRQLVQRDPRVLADPHVVRKVLLWKLEAILATETRATKKGRHSEARDKLEALAQAIAFTVGSGPTGWTEPHLFASQESDATAKVDEARDQIRRCHSRRGPDAAQIAASVGLDVEIVELLIERPRARLEAIDRVLAHKYGRKESWVRKQRCRAKKIDAPGE